MVIDAHTRISLSSILSGAVHSKVEILLEFASPVTKLKILVDRQ